MFIYQLCKTLESNISKINQEINAYSDDEFNFFDQKMREILAYYNNGCNINYLLKYQKNDLYALVLTSKQIFNLIFIISLNNSYQEHLIKSYLKNTCQNSQVKHHLNYILTYNSEFATYEETLNMIFDLCEHSPPKISKGDYKACLYNINSSLEEIKEEKEKRGNYCSFKHIIFYLKILAERFLYNNEQYLTNKNSEGFNESFNNLENTSDKIINKESSQNGLQKNNKNFLSNSSSNYAYNLFIMLNNFNSNHIYSSYLYQYLKDDLNLKMIVANLRVVTAEKILIVYDFLLTAEFLIAQILQEMDENNIKIISIFSIFVTNQAIFKVTNYLSEKNIMVEFFYIAEIMDGKKLISDMPVVDSNALNNASYVYNVNKMVSLEMIKRNPFMWKV